MLWPVEEAGGNVHWLNKINKIQNMNRNMCRVTFRHYFPIIYLHSDRSIIVGWRRLAERPERIDLLDTFDCIIYCYINHDVDGGFDECVANIYWNRIRHEQ